MAIPLIKTVHTAETLALALARQQRWVERHPSNVMSQVAEQLRARAADYRRNGFDTIAQALEAEAVSAEAIV